MSDTLAPRKGQKADNNYGRGRPSDRERTESVQGTQSILVRIRRPLRDRRGKRLTQLALAYYVEHEYRHAHVPCPIPPIDQPPKLDRTRKDAALWLACQLGRKPTDSEIAAEVASRYSAESREGAPANAIRRLRRLIREAQAYEYVHLGSEGFTGKTALPPSRN